VQAADGGMGGARQRHSLSAVHQILVMPFHHRAPGPGPVAPMTVTLQDAASCMAITPTEPAAPRTSNVSPRITRSCFKMPNVASAAAGGRRASLQVTFAGFGVHEDARTYSA
jgi:hypothetical protein